MLYLILSLFFVCAWSASDGRSFDPPHVSCIPQNIDGLMDERLWSALRDRSNRQAENFLRPGVGYGSVGSLGSGVWLEKRDSLLPRSLYQETVRILQNAGIELSADINAYDYVEHALAMSAFPTVQELTDKHPFSEKNCLELLQEGLSLVQKGNKEVCEFLFTYRVRKVDSSILEDYIVFVPKGTEKGSVLAGISLSVFDNAILTHLQEFKFSREAFLMAQWMSENKETSPLAYITDHVRRGIPMPKIFDPVVDALKTHRALGGQLNAAVLWHFICAIGKNISENIYAPYGDSIKKAILEQDILSRCYLMFLYTKGFCIEMESFSYWEEALSDLKKAFSRLGQLKL